MRIEYDYAMHMCKERTGNIMAFEEVAIERALTFIEPGPVVLVTTFDGVKNNVMTITWTMAMDFEQHIVITTGPWNYSFETLLHTRECVVCVPAADLLNTVVQIGMVSGTDTDKFKTFGLTALVSKYVKAPLIAECLACLECSVIDYIESYGFFVLQVRRVLVDQGRCERRLIHAVGDGCFVLDGETVSRRGQMMTKLPPGL